ncbi:DNA primase [Paenibacillus psychroresistens]|uniref:DNA primase n=1 Tax=Paenibacillus psychroresistens TaxID=1778678 RepID=A0A6B8RK01_9BACL|nr:DNA primase [Paenibacillus psychroresistens]QGQ95736.1 DNA primase [Paenibacillus psychroresistens]
MSNGRIPDSIIEAVLKHHDIVDVVGKFVHLSKQGRYMKGLCPFHSEKSPSFTVTPEKQIFYCYGCHMGGNAINFVKEMEGLSYGEAVRQMAEEANISIGWETPTEQQTELQLDKAKLLQAYELSTKLYHHVLLNTVQGKEAMQYLRMRGLTDKWIEFFQIGYAPPAWDTLAQFLEKRQFLLPLMEQGGLLSARSSGGYVDKFRDRILFPICDVKGRVIAFGGRAMGDVQPKYMNSPESVLFNKSSSLYNFHQARAVIRKNRQVVLFEGYVDVIKAWEAGVTNGVATMGTALTEEHAAHLKRNADEVVVCYDGDNAGQTAAFKSIATLEKAQLHVKIAMLPEGLDPDEYIGKHGAESFQREVIESAVPTIKYKLIFERKRFNLLQQDGKRQYLDVAIRMIAELPSAIDREQYSKELSVDYQLTLDTIKQEMNEHRQEFLKKQQTGDNKHHSWNNDMNIGRVSKKDAPLLEAHQVAEKKLLSAMIHDSEIATYVQQRLDEQFNVEAHAALAAYLYAYYAQGNAPDASRYIATLQDEQLESVASSILMLEGNEANNAQAIDDYIRVILHYPQLQALEQRSQEALRAQNAGDYALAAQIHKEISTLKQQLKSF